MTIKEMDAKYPKIWMVSYSTITMYHTVEKLFLTEAEAKAFYDSLDPLQLRDDVDRHIGQVHDIWGWSAKEIERQGD